MLLKTISNLLKEEIVDLLQFLSDDGQLQEIVRYPLSASDRPLSLHLADSRWTMLPMVVCHAICGQYERAVPLAASIGFFQTAGDVLDDIEDMDSSDSVVTRYGHAAAVNTATSLLMLGQVALTRLHGKGVNSDTIVAVMREVSRYGLTACIGQHREIGAHREPKRLTLFDALGQTRRDCFVG